MCPTARPGTVVDKGVTGVSVHFIYLSLALALNHGPQVRLRLLPASPRRAPRNRKFWTCRHLLIMKLTFDQVKPTHYTVVYDESSLGADELQQGTHNFSHLYARATKAVSLVPPAYYADLACERGRCYLNDFLLSDDKASSSGKGKKSREEEEARVFKAAEEAWGAGVSSLFP